MSETMKVALTFTAVDAASGYIAGLERRIDALGEAGKRMRGEFDAMQSHFANGLKGMGIAYTTMQFMRPGISAAAEMEASGLALQNSLAAANKSAERTSAEFKSMRATALFLNAHSPFRAPEIMRLEKLLYDSGFSPEDIAGRGGLAQRVAAISQLSGQSPEEVRELVETFHQQFGADTSGINSALDWIAKSGMEDKLPYLASGLLSVGTRANDMQIPLQDVVTTLGAIEKVAKRAGPAFGEFLKATRPDPTSSQAVRMRDTGLQFYKDGKFIGLAASQQILKQRFGGIKGNREHLLEGLFGSGAAVAEGLIKAEDIAAVSTQNERNLGLMQKTKNVNDSLAASYDQMTAAGKEMLGSVFSPLTKSLATVSGGGRSALEWLGKAAENHPKTAVGIASIGGIVAAAGTGYMIWNWAKALGNLKNIVGGLGGTGAGSVAKKVLEKAAGGMPVFVTNWPGVSGGTFSTMPDKVLSGTGSVATAGAGAMLATMPGWVAPTLAALPFAIPSGVAGYYTGRGLGKLGSAVKDRFGGIDFDKYAAAGNMQASEPALPNLTINLQVDKDGKLIADTDGKVNSLKINMDRGNWHDF